MDKEKPVRKTSEVIHITPGSSLMTRRGQSWLERDFDSIFDKLQEVIRCTDAPVFPAGNAVAGTEVVCQVCPLDVIDEGDHYLVHVELPSFSRENVEVRINSNGMSVRAKKEMEKEDKKKNYLHRERAYSAFGRSVAFPEEVDPEKAEGEMKEGVLERRVSKKESKPEAKTQKIALK